MQLEDRLAIDLNVLSDSGLAADLRDFPGFLTCQLQAKDLFLN